MRIAIANWSDRIAGGAEQYLASVIPTLRARGHTVGFWHEVSCPEQREPVLPGDGAIQVWDASRLGIERALSELERWRPDIIYCHGLQDPDIEARLQRVAPSVLFAHNYNGVCISGMKATAFPVYQPCQRRFGTGCLMNFYPRRCGGLSPVTMVRDYLRNARRLKLLGGYDRVITHSEHVRGEYERNGIVCDRVRFFTGAPPTAGTEPVRTAGPRERWRLLMMTRMTTVKGGHVLIDALPEIADGLKKPVSLTLAGDGPALRVWEDQAVRMMRRREDIEIRFPGWIPGADREAAFREADLMVVPSLWPEPFGMIGAEAGHWGVPSVAFRMGGIPAWLEEGVNGCLAALPPTPETLAGAVTRCLSDEAQYERLRAGARASARAMTIDRHYDDLMAAMDEALAARRNPALAAR